MKLKTYSRAEAEALALHFFQMKFPTTPDEFKLLFRQACKRLHTDVSGRDTKDEFVKMKLFYEEVTKQNPEWLFAGSGNSEEAKTGSGTLISELGLGLGPNKNGRDCGWCDHKGYTETVSDGIDRCKWCFLGVAHSKPCDKCMGTGKFGIKGQGVGLCPRCWGSGSINLRRSEICKQCRGGIVKRQAGKKKYDMCFHCQGTGEIEIHNPVLPKGRLAI